jgi:short-subunit dehydrogenase
MKYRPRMALPPTRDGGAALVTGASSGIGEEFARQLAARGYNLVLVARRGDRLSALAQQLGGASVRAEVLACDLAAPEETRALGARIGDLGLQVDVLVNNAGFGINGPFAERSLESQIGQIRVNCEALVTLAHLFLPAMLERSSGAIVNIASIAGLQPLPGEAVYSASKAFVLNFSEALHVEMHGTGVTVTAVSPGPVPTEWQAVAGRDSVPPFPPKIEKDQVVREALHAVEQGQRAIIPGRMVRIGMLSTRAVPNTLKLAAMRRMGWR